MKFVSIDEWLDDVSPEVPGCTEFTIQDRVRWAAIEFCRKTLASQETMTEIDLDAGEPLVTVPAPGSYVRPYMVIWAKTTQRFLKALNSVQLATRGIDFMSEATGEWPSSFIRESSDTIRVLPVPATNRAASMSIRAAYIPARNSEKVDAMLLDEYREAITAGALSKLLNMSKEEWYDPNEAANYGAEFFTQISNARAKVNKDHLYQDTQVVMSPFA